MTLAIADRLFETTVSTGSGPFALQGAVAGFQGFAVLGDSAKTTFYIDDGDATGLVQKWMDVLGTVTVSGGVTTLSVDQVLASSNNGSPVNFGTGTKNIRCGIGAKVLNPTDENLNYTRHYASASASGNQHIVTLPYAPLAYSDGMMIVYRAPATNTSTAIGVNVNGMGSKSLRINGAGPAVGSLASGALIVAVYRASNNTFEVVNAGFHLPLSGGNMTGAINEAMTTLASSATPDIWTGQGNKINYTGTATATGFTPAPQAGAERVLCLTDAAVFTAGPNVLIDGVASGASITLAAGDRVRVTALTTTQFRLQPIKADGTAVVAPAQYVKAFGGTDPSGNLRVGSVGLTVARINPGNYRFTFAAPQPDANYFVFPAVANNAVNFQLSAICTNRQVGYFDVLGTKESNGAQSPQDMFMDVMVVR